MKRTVRGAIMLIGCGLIVSGWAVTNSTEVKEQAVADVAAPLAADLLAGSAGEATNIDQREVIRNAGTTTYAFGVAGMVAGALLFGFVLPRGAVPA